MYYRAEFRRFAPNFSKEKGGEPGGADFVERGDSFSPFSFSLVIRRDFRQEIQVRFTVSVTRSSFV